jgi:uncharacterized metal-binding protein
MNAPFTVEEMLATNVAEAEKLWLAISEQCQPDRVEALVAALHKQFGFVMDEETNADAIMAMVGWMSRHAVQLAEDSGISHQGALMLMQMGVQRGVAAHLAIKQAQSEIAAHGLDS